MTNKTPNPGSNEAIDLGCTCPVLDNNRGRGYANLPDGKKLFWQTAGCPVHKPGYE